jgi:hypothetical protein
MKSRVRVSVLIGRFFKMATKYALVPKATLASLMTQKIPKSMDEYILDDSLKGMRKAVRNKRLKEPRRTMEYQKNLSNYKKTRKRIAEKPINVVIKNMRKTMEAGTQTPAVDKTEIATDTSALLPPKGPEVTQVPEVTKTTNQSTSAANKTATATQAFAQIPTKTKTTKKSTLDESPDSDLLNQALNFSTLDQTMMNSPESTRPEAPKSAFKKGLESVRKALPFSSKKQPPIALNPKNLTPQDMKINNVMNEILDVMKQDQNFFMVDVDKNRVRNDNGSEMTTSDLRKLLYRYVSGKLGADDIIMGPLTGQERLFKRLREPVIENILQKAGVQKGKGLPFRVERWIRPKR